MKGVGDRVVTEGFTTEQHHLGVSQRPGGGTEMLSSGHTFPPSVFL